MAQRSPPAALLELQQNFPTLSITAFDGNWAAYEMADTIDFSVSPVLCEARTHGVKLTEHTS